MSFYTLGDGLKATASREIHPATDIDRGLIHDLVQMRKPIPTATM